VSRVNVDTTALLDPRFARFAQLLGLADADHARGRMLHVWSECTRRGEFEIPQWLVEQLLGAAGPQALIDSELARWGAGRGDSKTRRMRIAGAEKRCMWLQRNQEQAAKAGKARAAGAQRVDGRFAPADPSAPAPAPAPAPAQDQTPKAPKGGKRAPKAGLGPTPAERASAEVVLARLGAQNGVTYSGTEKHVSLIAAQLRAGVTEVELRAVVAYCADPEAEGALGWRDSAKMRKHLCPETLFGPQNISRYLDPARALYRELIAKHAAAHPPRRDPARVDQPPLLALIHGGREAG
jgi:pyruvate/2-oxoglutarate dehydrogenase complex dihydrolipoamide acyltransferase (E2) component